MRNLKYKRIRKKAKKQYKYLNKTIQEVEREILILFRIIKEEKPHLSEKEIYTTIKQHIIAEEKALNYDGARTVHMSFGMGILSFMLTAIILNPNDEQGLLLMLSNFLEDIREILVFPFWLLYFLLLIIVLAIFIGSFILLGLRIITLLDKIIRKKLYKHKLMYQLIEAKISNLSNDNKN